MYDDVRDIHIGSIIRRRVDSCGMSYAEFARRINCERSSLYHLFKCKSIDIDRLILISKVLDYDFIRNVYQKKQGRTAKIYIAVEIPGDALDLSKIDKRFLKLMQE